MFKLAVFAAILAVAVAAPGGLSSIRGIHDLGLGPIHAPVITSHAISHATVHAAAPAHAPAVTFAAAPAHFEAPAPAHIQAIAPLVHTAPIVTKNVLTSAPLPLFSAHSSH